MTTSIPSYPFESSRRVWNFPDLPEEKGSEDSWITKLRDRINRLFRDTSARYQDNYASDAHSESPSLSYTTEFSLPTLLAKLHITIAHPAEVIDYILQNPSIGPVVMYACLLTEEGFRHDATITLDLYQDPESDDHYLTIYVRQKEYDKNILKRIDKICDEYEPALKGQSGWLLLTTDYKHPSS